MALPALVGHAEARRILGGAARAGKLAQAILLQGPAGVGKERLALWIAQAIVCEAGEEAPCGTCRNCRLVDRLEHPDVHWFFPLPRPDATSPEKLRDRLEEARGTELQAWRDDPFRRPQHEKAPAHFLASVRTIQRLASVRPALGHSAVFVIGDAEWMVPQESSPEAANAFLKLLEEPSPHATFLLTSSRPGALLPTIRSRVLTVRVGNVPEPEIARLLTEGGLADPTRAAEIATRSRGSTGRAIRLARGADQALDESRKAGRDMLIAAVAESPVARFVAANERRSGGGRGELVPDLESFAEWLRDLLATASGAGDRVLDPDAAPLLQRILGRWSCAPPSILDALDRVAEARELALGNVNPQLVLAVLLAEVQKDLLGRRTATGAR